MLRIRRGGQEVYVGTQYHEPRIVSGTEVAESR